jgi:hypothetical protein
VIHYLDTLRSIMAGLEQHIGGEPKNDDPTISTHFESNIAPKPKGPMLSASMSGESRCATVP